MSQVPFLADYSRLAPIYGMNRELWDSRVSAVETAEFEKVVYEFDTAEKFHGPINVLPGFEELLENLAKRF